MLSSRTNPKHPVCCSWLMTAPDSLRMHDQSYIQSSISSFEYLFIMHVMRCPLTSTHLHAGSFNPLDCRAQDLAQLWESICIIGISTARQACPSVFQLQLGALTCPRHQGSACIAPINFQSRACRAPLHHSVQLALTAWGRANRCIGQQPSQAAWSGDPIN